MWKNRVKPETHNPDSDDQLELELDDRYRQAEQFTFDFPEENEREKLARVRRLLET